jgi:hypothetical protein
MNSETYQLSGSSTSNTYEFTSSGKTGEHIMQVRIRPNNYIINNREVYNLGFGKLTSANTVNYLFKSNNGDKDRILRTVAEAAADHLRKYPEHILYFSGSTNARHTLYRWGLAANLEKIVRNNYVVIGYRNEEFELFSANTKYDYYLVAKRL